MKIKDNMPKSTKEAGYKILYLLATSDRHLHSKELEVLDKFLDKCFPEETLVDRDHFDISNLSTEDKLSFMVELCEYLKDSIEHKLLRFIFRFAMHIVICDRKIPDEEELRFKIVASFWAIDIKDEVKKLTKSDHQTYSYKNLEFIDFIFADFESANFE